MEVLTLRLVQLTHTTFSSTDYYYKAVPVCARREDARIG